jgi:ubiquitin carboxyl-terminal hydrolase 14
VDDWQITKEVRSESPSSSAKIDILISWFLDRIRLSSPEAPTEESKVSSENFLELKCNISGTTNYMMQGLSEGMVQEIEKRSESLGRDAVYKEETKIDRLPSCVIRPLSIQLSSFVTDLFDDSIAI